MPPSDLLYKKFLIIEINVFVKFSWDSVSFHEFLKVFFFLKKHLFLLLFQKRIKMKIKNDPYSFHSDDPLFRLVIDLLNLVICKPLMFL